MAVEMKLTVLKTIPPQKNNGAEIGNFERFRILKALGWEIQIESLVDDKLKDRAVQIIQKFGGVEKNPDLFELDHIPCRLHTGKDLGQHDVAALGNSQIFFHELLNREKPDLAWCQYTDHAATAAALTWNPKKSWIDITDNEFPRLRDLLIKPEWTAFFPLYLQIEHLVVASPYMQKTCAKDFPGVHVLHLPYPIPDLRNPHPGMERKFWLFINPIEVKGLNVVREIARRLPDHDFAFVRNWAQNTDIKDLPPNVTLVPQQRIIKHLLAYSRGLLIPSLWNEAFGRVALEAMALSTPVLASNRGALPETVGSGGLVLDPNDVESWIKVMQNPDPDFWKNLVERGHTRVKEYLTMCERIYGEISRGIF